MQPFNVSTDYEEIGSEKRSSNTWKHTALAVTIMALVLVAVVAVSSQDQISTTARQQMISLDSDNFQTHCKQLCARIGARFSLPGEAAQCEADCPSEKPKNCPQSCDEKCTKHVPADQKPECPQFCALECNTLPIAADEVHGFIAACYAKCDGEGGDMTQGEIAMCHQRCDKLKNKPPTRKECEEGCPARCEAAAHPSQVAECPTFCRDMCGSIPPVKMMQDNAVSDRCKSICDRVLTGAPAAQVAECEADCPNHRPPSGECRPQCMSVCQKQAGPQAGGCGTLCDAECGSSF